MNNKARKVEGHGGISRSEIERTLSNVAHRNCCKVIYIYVRAYVRYLLFNHSFFVFVLGEGRA